MSGSAVLTKMTMPMALNDASVRETMMELSSIRIRLGMVTSSRPRRLWTAVCMFLTSSGFSLSDHFLVWSRLAKSSSCMQSLALTRAGETRPSGS